MVYQEPQSTLPTLSASSSNRGTEIEEGDSEDGSETPVVEVAERLDRMELAYTQQAQKMETEYRRREERDGKRLQQEQQREEKRREEEREYRKMESERWMEFMQMTQEANHDLRREEMRNRQKENEEEKQKRRDRETRKTGHDAPKLRPLQDTTEIEAYLINFKAHMTMFEIHPDYWVPNLMALLDEKSLAYLTDLPTESKKDIDTLGHTLMEYHGISTSFYREEWRNFREKPGETGHEYVKRIHSLITKWTRDCENREKLIDRILIEKACQSLSDTRTQAWVRERYPSSRKALAALIDEYRFSHPRLEEPKKQWARPQSNRQWGDQYKQRMPMEQDRGEAKPGEGKRFRLPAFDAIKGPRCFGCNDYGHIAAKCPKKIQSLVCYPNLKHSTLFGIPGIINGRQVGQMILDTASGITQVHQRWVPKEAMTGGNVRVTGVEVTTHTLPIATVRLQVNDCDQEMPVAVSNKLEYDALLGLDVALVRNMIPEGGEEIRQGRPRRICPRPETYAEPSEQGTESEDSGSEEDGEVPSRQENLGEQPTESQVDTSTEDAEETADTTDVLGMVPMTEDMFLHKDDKEKQTRGQKRQERKKYQAIWGQTIPLDGGPEQIREEQIQWNYQEESVANLGHPSSGRTISYIEDGNHPNRLRKWNN